MEKDPINNTVISEKDLPDGFIADFGNDSAG